MAFTVRTLPRAEFDAQQIYDWISERSPDGARRWWDAFLVANDNLKHDPVRYSLAPEAQFCNREIRQFLFRTRRGKYFRLLYVIVETEVRIIRVRGPGQPDLSPDELL
jgi:plasmid stabilization system protein ParE